MTILCYHSVDPAWESPLAVRPEEFEAHCDWLTRHRTVVPLADAATRLDRSGRLPSGLAVITFDDGFTGVLDHALPVLRRHGLPATVFLVAQTLTDEGLAADWVRTPPAGPLTTLTRDQVLELRRASTSSPTAGPTATWSTSGTTPASPTSAAAGSCSRTCSAFRSPTSPTRAACTTRTYGVPRRRRATATPTGSPSPPRIPDRAEGLTAVS